MVHVALRCFSSFCFALCCFTKHCFTRLIEYVARPVVSRDASAISAICYSVLGFGRNLGNNIHVAFSWLWGKLEAGTCDGVLASANAVGGNVLPMRCYADAILRHLCGDSGLFAKGQRSYLIWIVGGLCGHEETCHMLLGVRPRTQDSATCASSSKKVSQGKASTTTLPAQIHDAITRAIPNGIA